MLTGSTEAKARVQARMDKGSAADCNHSTKGKIGVSL
jgi:hypothetical protein